MDRTTFIETRDKIKGHLYKTGQTTVYAIGDDGDRQKGIAKRYKVRTTDVLAGTVNVDSPHYAAATIAFAATTPGTITDAAGLLATVLTGDKIRIRGSALNDNGGVEYNVSTGGVPGTIRTTEATVLEAAGAYITICKRATHSNNTVIDLNNRRRLEWTRYIQTGKIGPASDGKLNWYNTATSFTLHPANADVAMVAGNILRVVGSDESSRYFPGAVLVCSGFTNAVNNLPGLTVVSVSFAGGNTDIVVDPGNQVLIAEAVGNFGIKIVCQNIFAYTAAVNTVLLGGYGDWRVPNRKEIEFLVNDENANGQPDTTAFTGFPVTSYLLCGTTIKMDTSKAFYFDFSTSGQPVRVAKTSTGFTLLVRGGG